jgi:hypothetical protein
MTMGTMTTIPIKMGPMKMGPSSIGRGSPGTIVR